MCSLFVCLYDLSVNGLSVNGWLFPQLPLNSEQEVRGSVYTVQQSLLPTHLWVSQEIAYISGLNCSWFGIDAALIISYNHFLPAPLCVDSLCCVSMATGAQY